MSKIEYHEDTALLIDRMCKLVERKSFILNKAKAQECILKTYDLFNLSRPNEVVWCNDLFNKTFAGSAGNARSVENAWSAWSAGNARSAWSAWSARNAKSARDARNAWSAGSAGSARSAWSAWSARNAKSARDARNAWSAGSAWSARSALDYDFEHFVFEFEYCLNPDSENPPNEDDKLYLEYSELLIEAIEYGAGYRVEWEGRLYIVPAPLVLIDSQNRFHSEIKPAIRWKNGSKFYYLKGEEFNKPIWQKLVDKTMTAKEIMQILDADKRAIAISMLSPDEMIRQLNANLIDTGVEGTQLYECTNFMDTGQTEYCMKMKDWSTDRTFIEFVPPEIGKKKSAVFAQASAYGIPEEDYLLIKEMSRG